MAIDRYSYSGVRTSLGGVVSKRDAQTLIFRDLPSVTVTAIIHLLDANPRRLSALIVNNSDTDQIIVMLGENKGSNDIILNPHGHVLINNKLPFTGAVCSCTVSAASVPVFVYEESFE